MNVKDERWEEVASGQMAESADLLFAENRTLEGMIDYQSTKEDDLDQVNELIGKVSAPLLVEGDRPSWSLVLYQLGLALALALGAAFLFRRTRKAVPLVADGAAGDEH